MGQDARTGQDDGTGQDGGRQVAQGRWDDDGAVRVDLGRALTPVGAHAAEQVGGQAEAAVRRVERDHVSAPSGREELRRLAADDAPGVRDLLAEAGEILGRAAAGVVNVLAVRALTVIGESHVLWPYLAPGFHRAVDDGVIAALSGLEITLRTWDDSGHARGAASLVPAASLAS
ncbi:hypothetical protein JYK22_09570, partial [Nonomuraea sp. RK-328]|nr:hypothetical protein [Nonomuraea sp. RK-328]